MEWFDVRIVEKDWREDPWKKGFRGVFTLAFAAMVVWVFGKWILAMIFGG